MRDYSTLTKAIVVWLFAVVGWAICGAIMAIGPLYLPMETTLIVHAIGAPVAFAALSAVYFTRFGFTTPLQTAVAFLAVVVGLDVFLVAPFFVDGFEMFTSAHGTWVPFALIFLATLLTGWVVTGDGGRLHAT